MKPTLNQGSSYAVNILDSESLTKYQACHQCRKRKMKCDARRPVCGACSRSHRYAWLRSKDRASFPPLQDCMYDFDIVEEKTESETILDGEHIDLYDMSALEEAIASLENKLKSKTDEVQRLRYLTTMLEEYDENNMTDGSGGLPVLSHSSSSYSRSPSMPPSMSPGPSGPKTIIDPFYVSSFTGEEDGVTQNEVPRETSMGLNPMHDLFRLTWPAEFPHPELFYHLVDTFFSYFPYANRLLHRATFETCLALSPSSPDFPQATLIHSICAVASLYTVHIHRPPPRHYTRTPLSLRNDFEASINTPSFAEEQSMCSRRTLKKALLRSRGGAAFQALQAMILIGWFECANGRWPRTWQYSGDAINIALTLNLQLPSFVSSHPSRLPCRQYETQHVYDERPGNFIEEENRRNCFWLAYGMDRLQTITAGWNQFLDDKWIMQCLPAADEWLFQSEEVPFYQRQQIHTPDLFSNHPPDQTDSFVLWTKTVILVSLAKSFNRRYNAGIASREHPSIAELEFPPVSSAFQQLHAVIHSFIGEFPKEYRDPLRSGSLDIVLFMALLLPHMALIILHSPHVNEANLNGFCAKECLMAARHVLAYLCKIKSTSFDLAVLDPWCSVIFFNCCHELMRNAVDRARKKQWALAWQYRMEMQVFDDAIHKMAERLQLADRHGQILQHLCEKELEPMFDPARTVIPPEWTATAMTNYSPPPPPDLYADMTDIFLTIPVDPTKVQGPHSPLVIE